MLNVVFLKALIIGILSSATRKPDTNPMVKVINKKITMYFPKSLFNSLERRFHNGFLIVHRLTSQARLLRLLTH